MGKENWIKVAKQGKLVNYSSIKDVLGNVDLNFDNLEEPKKQRFQSAFKNGTVETPIAVKFSENDYDLVAGNTRLSGLVKNGEDPKIWIVNIGSINEYDNSGPTTPKTYIVKDDGTYKEVPIKLLSKIPNLTYDMGGGETNYYPEKNIVIIDNIPIEEFVKDPGEIKDEKIYVEYNLNQSYSFPKANKILVAQLVYHLDDIKSFAKTVANSLKDGGVIEFFSDVMSKEDKMFLEYLSSEFGFEIPLTLSKYKNSTIEITKNKYTPPTEYYIYEITDDIGDISKISTTKKGSWWKYVKVKGNLNFKSIEGLNPEHFNQLGLEPNEALKKQLEQFSEILGYNIIKIKKLNESNKPYKHKHGFDDKLGKDPFGLNQYARELAQGLEEAIVGDKIKEAKEEVTDSMVVVLSRNDNQINLYNLKTNEALGNINTYGNEVTGVAAKKGYGPLMYELGMANIYPNGLQSDRRGNTEPAAEAVWKKYIEGASPNIKVEKLTPKDKDYRTTYAGDGYDSSYIPDFYNYKFYNPNTTTLKQLIQKGNTLSDELRKKIILDNDKLYNDLVRESIVGDKIECDNCGWSWDIKDGGDDLYTCHKCWHDNTPKQLNEGRYDTLANKLSSIAFKAFKDIHDRGDKEGSFKFRVDTPDDEHDIPSEDFYFDFEGKVEITDGEYGVDGGANSGFDNGGNEITPLLSVKFKIPKNPSNTYPTWQDISFDIKDVIRHELEHLTQDGDNEKPGKYIEDDQLLRDLIDAKLLPKAQYFKLEKEIDAMLQGLYFKAKKLKRPYKKVIDDYLATQSITQEEKNDILKIWRSRVKALSLPLFESEGISELFTIYLDIDGVIADFDKRFTELAGMGPREYEDSFGSEKFWDFIDIKHKIKFFSKMDWMPEGKKLYNFIKQFDHKLLSAPSKNDASKVGKRIWAKENTPETQLILSPAYNKKNYADKSNILIDDRESNIQQWKDAGGIGILFKSTDQVIDELKKIMNL
jgi:hypothetical protein